MNEGMPVRTDAPLQNVSIKCSSIGRQPTGRLYWTPSDSSPRRTNRGPMRRIAVFRHHLFVHSETFIRDQASAMTRHSPVFVARRDVHDTPRGAEAHAIFGARDSLNDAAYGMTARSGKFRELLRGLDIKLIHAHFGPEGVYAAHTAEALSIPLVTTLHGRDATVSRRELLKAKRPVAFRYGLQRATLTSRSSLVLCVSEEIRRSAELAGMNPERLRTHYIGVDTGTLRRPVTDRPLEILHVARLVEKKGTADLLSAMAAVVKQVPEARLTILGDGPLRAELEDRARALEISHAVDFRGRVSQAEVHNLMGTARVFCLPSVEAANGDREGLPIALLEAMASGMAVVATRHSGIPEAITADTGLLVEERDVSGLARALHAVLADSGTAESLGHNAAQRARSHFDVNVQTRSLESIFDDLSRSN